MLKIIEKWYKLLDFEKDYGLLISELFSVADKYNLETITYEKMKEINNPRLSLAFFLFKCEQLEKKYEEKSIPKEILYDTLSDLKIWADRYRDYSKEEIGFEENGWLIHHLDFRLFKLGRLQFAFGKAECTDKEYGLNEGEQIMEVHIPSGGKLSEEECKESFEKAEKFFKKYFPEYEYNFYTCHSWLLDDNLRKILRADSNILKFREFFSVIREDDSNAAIKYIFRWNIKEEEVQAFECLNTTQEKMKEYFISGGKLFESYGIIKR